MAVVDGLDPSALRLFLAVVDLGSVSKAAARHGLAQPSATAKLHKLERQLGVQLLHRTPSGSAATPAGVRLAPACAEVVAAAVALVDGGAMLREEQTRLTITTTRHVADHFLPGWIAACDLQDVRVDLDVADTLTVARTVRAGEAALGFTDGPAAPLGLRSQLVAGEPVVPVVGRAHRWYARRRAVTGRDVVTTSLVMQLRGAGIRDVVEAALAPHGLSEGEQRIEVATSAAARLCAVNGAGVAFLPRCRVERQLRSGELAALAIRDVVIEQPVRAVWRGARPADPHARRLVDHLRSALSRRPARDVDATA
jgi:DNA-binding transcriptional LysR family regulator